MRVSFTEADKSDVGLTPAGSYKCVIEGVEDRVTSTGKEFVLIRFRSEDGRQIVHNIFAGDYFAKMVYAVVSACGLETISDTSELVGKTCVVKVEHEEYDGEMQARINPFKGFSPVPQVMDDGSCPF